MLGKVKNSTKELSLGIAFSGSIRAHVTSQHQRERGNGDAQDLLHKVLTSRPVSTPQRVAVVSMRSRNVRWTILPVAVRGISLSLMKTIERGRL